MAGAEANTGAMGTPTVDPETAQAVKVFADLTAYADEPRPLLVPAEADDFARAQLDAGMGLRTLIHMDDPSTGWCARSLPTGFAPRPCAR